MLAIMIASIAGQYQDIVSLTPIVNIDSQQIKKHFLAVLKSVSEIGFRVVSTTLDGHSSNCRFYKEELGNGEMQVSFQNPFSDGQPVFLLFDTTHLFKNFFTNFMNKKFFECPPFHGDDEPFFPNFEHLKKLHQLEADKPAKMAYKLTEKCLAAQPIDRTNVKLADAIFHESTSNALRYYSSQFPGFSQTAHFIEIIRTWWDILNVRNQFLAQRKLDDDRLPFTIENIHAQEFLSRFLEWLRLWQRTASKGKCLSVETFKAAQQTTLVMPKLGEFLIVEGHLSFVLFGKIQSDPLEKRFGYYRHLGGSNFFISAQQVLNAEKSIRGKCLVKFSKFDPKELKQLFAESILEKEKDVQESVDVLLEQLDIVETVPVDDLEDDIQAICFYIAGYCARKVVNHQKCESCTPMLAISRDPQKNQLVIANEECSSDELSVKERFFDLVDRGGLFTPSDFSLNATVKAYTIHKTIFMNDETKATIMSSPNPRAAFVKVCSELSSKDDHFQKVCACGHNFVEKVLPQFFFKMFNLCTSNYVRDVNSVVYASKKRKCDSKSSSAGRKVQKLQSN